jgi:hypothetical protein
LFANKRKVLGTEGKVKATSEIENEKKKEREIEVVVCREFDPVNSKIQTIWKNRSKMISVFEQNGSKIKRFRKPERTDVDEALLVRL